MRGDLWGFLIGFLLVLLVDWVYACIGYSDGRGLGLLDFDWICASLFISR